MDSFQQFSETHRPLIDAALADLMDGLPAACPVSLCEAMNYSLLAPGKRIRPLLTLMAVEAVGGTVEDAVPAACAVEMVHAFSLIHDDLPGMDNDDLRRGQPTCHKAFGEAEAILAGDGLALYPFMVINEAYGPMTAQACSAILLSASMAMIGGQSDDMLMEKRRDGTLGELEAIHERKTGALIQAALVLGALVNGVSGEPIDALSEYGRNLGLAFQITDDLLDVEASDEQAGKMTHKDAERGKLTYPGLLGAEESEQRAQQSIELAKRALRSANLESAPLMALADFVAQRNF